METPEELAPQVVAVIVTCDPGPCFEEELVAFAAQDYPGLSVLVLDNGVVDVTERVAAVLPDAYVRRLEHNQGFGAGANAVLGMVEGASHFLFCHDDVAPDPEAVGILVEESFRSNAGVVSPKLVSWEDPRRLLHVGMAVDKGGAVVDRVEPGELDQGQHDSVRDVFLAPGGCTLVRADLFAEIGGFDPQIFAMGEDLDLCWRALVAGARVVVAPSARVRHLELLASGVRGLPADVRHAVPSDVHSLPVDPFRFESGVWTASQAPASAAESAIDEGLAAEGAGPTLDALVQAGTVPGHEAPGPSAGGTIPADGSSIRRRRVLAGRRMRRGTEQVTLQSLQRRHELRAVLKDYGVVHRARVLPQLVVLSVAEIFIAWATGHGDRAAAVIHAWRWNVTERASLRGARAEVRATRRLSDATVRKLQLHGSARLTAYLRRAVTYGALAARLGRIEETEGAETVGESAAEAEHRRVARATRTARGAVWTVAVVILVFGSRELFGSGFPYVGQLLPFASWISFLHHFFSGWQPYGVGTTTPATPGTGLLGLGGLVLFGGVGLLQKVVVLGCLPVGAIGMSRLMGSFGSVRARLASSIVYLAIPLPYDALATGRWDGLLAYAACPWIVGRLARAAAGPGDTSVDRSSGSSSALGRRSAREAFVLLGAGHGAAGHKALAPWRTSLAGRALGLGVLEAILTSLAPPGAVLTLCVAAGLALGTVVVGRRGSLKAAARIAAVGAGATVVTIVLLAPWSVSMLSGPGRWQQLFGLASLARSGPTWGALLHLGVGPIGDTPLAWGFVVAAALPLVIGAGPRLAWAGRAWVLAAVAWVLAWCGGRGWLGAMSAPTDLMLVPAGVAIAMAIGLGVAAFEEDLPSFRFGWRQAVAGLAAVVAAVGTLPLLAATLSGRWDTPTSGYGQATSWMARQSKGNFRVLWLGDPSVLPGGSWQVAPGLAYSLSEGGLPDVTSLWPGTSPGPAAALGTDVVMTESAKTVLLGQLLAPYAVRYVVLVSTLGSSTPGSAPTVQRSLPPALIGGLADQVDLRQVIDQSGFEVFVDDAALPERALHPAPPAASGHGVAGVAKGTAVSPGVGDLSGWAAVLRGSPGSTHVTGRAGAGTLFDAVAPAREWQLEVLGGRTERAHLAFGYGASFDVRRPGTVTLRFKGSWRHGLAVWAEVALWVVVLAALGTRRRWFDRWLGPSRLRRAGAHRQHAGANRAEITGPDGFESGLVSGAHPEGAR